MKSMYKENMCVRNTVVKVRNKEYTDNENDSICADASADVKLRQHSFLYGSCVRGDYRKDSDADTAQLTGYGCIEVKIG